MPAMLVAKRMQLHLEAGLLSLPDDFPLGSAYFTWKENLYKKNWVVYAKPPFGGPQNVVKYLARYSHRVAISNQRIINITDEQVSFRYKDYADGARQKVMTLKGTHFLQRFCLHIVPARFRKIRHYGFLSNAAKNKRLNQARQALWEKQIIALTRAQRKVLARNRLFGKNIGRCPCCQQGHRVIFDVLSPNKDPPAYLGQCFNRFKR